jgi:hypothetical protein
MDTKTKNILVAASGVVVVALTFFLGYKYVRKSSAENKKSEEEPH